MYPQMALPYQAPPQNLTAAPATVANHPVFIGIYVIVAIAAIIVAAMYGWQRFRP